MTPPDSERAIRLAEKIPDSATTDKLKGFAKGFENAVSKKVGKAGGPVHKKDAGISKIRINNNIYERLNGTLKGRLKLARGFRAGLPALAILFLAHYNLFRQHICLGKKTPAESPGVVIKGPDRWKTAIQYAALYLA